MLHLFVKCANNLITSLQVIFVFFFPYNKVHKSVVIFLICLVIIYYFAVLLTDLKK